MFLKNIYENKLEHSEDMLNLLKQQTRTEKIPKGIPSGVETANKTGELDHVENDAAIVFDGENPYIICVMADNLSDTTEARRELLTFLHGCFMRIFQNKRSDKKVSEVISLAKISFFVVLF